MASDHEMVDRAGAMGVDPPRGVQPRQTDAESVLYEIEPFVPLTIMRMSEPCGVTAMGSLVMPPGLSQLDDQTLPAGRDL